MYSAYRQTILSGCTDFHARFLSQIVEFPDVGHCYHSRRIEDEVAKPAHGTMMCWTKKKSLLWEEKWETASGWREQESREISKKACLGPVLYTHEDQVDVTTHIGSRPTPSRSTLAEDKSQISSRRLIAQSMSICASGDSESHTIRFLCVKFFTRCSALWLSEAALGKERLRSSDSRAV